MPAVPGLANRLTAQVYKVLHGRQRNAVAIGTLVELLTRGATSNTKSAVFAAERENWSAETRPLSNPRIEFGSAPSGEWSEEWSAARDTFRTLFLVPPPDVQAAFDKLAEPDAESAFPVLESL